MDTFDLSSFRYGGVNMTGFRLVNQGSRAARAARADWARLNAPGEEEGWRFLHGGGAGGDLGGGVWGGLGATGNISVSCFYALSVIVTGY